MDSVILTFVVALLGAGIGAYAGAYLKEKGKNMATREDVDRLVRKSEEIKAEISSELWHRKTRWSARRDVYARLLENVEELREVLRKDQVTRQLKPARDLDEKSQGFQDALLRRYGQTLEGVRRAAAVAVVVLDRDGAAAVARWQTEWAEARDRWWKSELELTTADEQLQGQISALDRLRQSLIEIARKDLLDEQDSPLQKNAHQPTSQLDAPL